MRRLVWVLKSTPTAHVIDKNYSEICLTTHHILNERRQTLPVFNHHTALPGIGIGVPDDEPVLCGVLLNFCLLIGNRVLLVFGGHADIFSSRYGGRGYLNSLCHRPSIVVEVTQKMLT